MPLVQPTLDGASDDVRPIHLTLAADRNFAFPLATTLASVAANCQGRIDVTVLEDGFSQDLKCRVLRNLPSSIRVSWERADRARFSSISVPDWITKATLFRLLIPDVLEGVNRTLYLDCDLLVLQDLDELWSIDLQGKQAGAIPDAGSPWAAGNGTQWRQLGLNPWDPYFNAGVMLMDLASWRRSQVHLDALALLSSGPLTFADQDALNVVLRRDWLSLPRKWNVQTNDVLERGVAWALDPGGVESALASPAILHFTERPKPWEARCRHPLVDQWLAMAELTAWRGYQPPASRLSSAVHRHRRRAFG